MSSPLLARFCQIYQGLNKDNLDLLSEVYSEQIQFRDPLHEINGLIQLRGYFQHLYSNLQLCHFEITEVIEQGNQASIIWTMQYAHPKIASAKTILVHGSSHLSFSDKIDYHRDYLDLGEMLYEHLPVLATLVKVIKKRARQ